MQKNFSNKNNNAVNFLNMHLVSTSFHDVMLTLLVFLLPSGLGIGFFLMVAVFPVSCQHPKSFATRNTMFTLKFSSFSVLDSFVVTFICLLTLLQPDIISLICTSELQPFFYGGFTRARCYFFVCLLVLKPIVQLQVCIPLAAGPLVSGLCSIFHHPKSLPLHTDPRVSLVLPGPYFPVLVKPWRHHRKINKSNENQPESPKELEKLLSQPNQPKKRLQAG